MDLEKKKKLQCWLYWYNIDEAEDLLEDMESYLILHKDYKYPLKAVYNARVPGFSFYTVRGIETTRLSDNKITHFAELLSKDEYLEFINLCNSQGDTIETQEPTKKTKAKEEAE